MSSVRNVFETAYYNREAELRLKCDASHSGLSASLRRYFKVLTDHQALLSILWPNRGNKSHLTRINRWRETNLPFDFEVEQIARAKMGLTD